MKIANDRRQRRGGPRGKSNGNERGSAAARRARKKWLIATYPARERFTFMERVITPTLGMTLVERTITFPAPGKTRCYACGTLLDFDTLTVDRIVPGARGGKYVRENVRGACATCNSATAVNVK